MNRIYRIAMKVLKFLGHTKMLPKNYFVNVYVDVNVIPRTQIRMDLTYIDPEIRVLNYFWSNQSNHHHHAHCFRAIKHGPLSPRMHASLAGIVNCCYPGHSVGAINYCC